jgi:hypothetical protein
MAVAVAPKPVMQSNGSPGWERERLSMTSRPWAIFHWFSVGDALYNCGEMLGLPRAHERAASAYRRAIELDASFAPAREGLVMTAASSGDTTTVRRFGGRYLSADSAEGTSVIRWRVAVALADSIALKRLRASFDTISTEELYPITLINSVSMTGSRSRMPNVSPPSSSDGRVDPIIGTHGSSRLLRWLSTVGDLLMRDGSGKSTMRNLSGLLLTAYWMRCTGMAIVSSGLRQLRNWGTLRTCRQLVARVYLAGRTPAWWSSGAWLTVSSVPLDVP